MNRRIYLSPPDLSGNEAIYIQEAIESNWIAPFGHQLDFLVSVLKEKIETPYVVPVNSGTSAIHLALLALQISEGDIVFCPSFTFAASVFPVLYQKATPVFIDSEKQTWNMDPALLEQAIQDAIQKKQKPKAIILVHIYGFPAQIEKIAAIAHTYNIALIEDAAESMGATYNGKATGTFGVIGAVSFNGNKLVTGGTGGAVLTNDICLFEKVNHLSNQAKEDKSYYEHAEVGYNYRMSNVNAAIARAQMEQLEQKIEKKKQIRAWYHNHLQNVAAIKYSDVGIDNAWLTCIDCTVSGIEPEAIRALLETNNIESRRLWNPMHQQPVFKDMTCYLNGNSDSIFCNGLCLPSGTQLQEEDIVHITDIMKRIL